MIEVNCTKCGSMFYRRGKTKGFTPFCPTCKPGYKKKEKSSLKTQSWKEIVELHHAELDSTGMPEDMYTDPAESTPDELQ